MSAQNSAPPSPGLDPIKLKGALKKTLELKKALEIECNKLSQDLEAKNMKIEMLMPMLDDAVKEKEALFQKLSEENERCFSLEEDLNKLKEILCKKDEELKEANEIIKKVKSEEKTNQNEFINISEIDKNSPKSNELKSTDDFFDLLPNNSNNLFFETPKSTNISSSIGLFGNVNDLEAGSNANINKDSDFFNQNGDKIEGPKETVKQQEKEIEKIKSSQALIEQLKTENAMLSNQVQQLNQDQEKLMENCSELVEKLAQCQDELSSLKSNQIVEDNNKSSEKSAIIICQLKEENEKLLKEISEFQNQHSNLCEIENENERLKEEQTQVLTNCSELTMKLAEVQDELNRMKSDTKQIISTDSNLNEITKNDFLISSFNEADDIKNEGKYNVDEFRNNMTISINESEKSIIKELEKKVKELTQRNEILEQNQKKGNEVNNDFPIFSSFVDENINESNNDIKNINFGEQSMFPPFGIDTTNSTNFENSSFSDHKNENKDAESEYSKPLFEQSFEDFNSQTAAFEGNNKENEFPTFSSFAEFPSVAENIVTNNTKEEDNKDKIDISLLEKEKNNLKKENAQLKQIIESLKAELNAQEKLHDEIEQKQTSQDFLLPNSTDEIKKDENEKIMFEELESKIRSLSTKNEELESQIKEISITKHEDERFSLLSENEKLKEEQTKLLSNCSELESKLMEVQNEIQQLKNFKSCNINNFTLSKNIVEFQLDTNINNSSNNISPDTRSLNPQQQINQEEDEEEEDIFEMEQKNRELSIQFDSLKKQNQKDKKQTENLIRQIRILEGAETDLLGRISELEIHGEKLSRQCALLEEIHQSNQIEFEQLMQRNADLEEEKESLEKNQENEFIKLLEQFTELQKTNDDLSKEIENLKQTNNEIQLSKEKNEISFKNENQKLIERIEELLIQEQNTNILDQKNRNEIDQDMNEISDENNASINENKIDFSLKQTNVLLSQQNEILLKEISDFQKQVEELQNETLANQKVVEDLKIEISASKEMAHSEKMKNHILEENIDMINKKNSKLEQKNEEIGDYYAKEIESLQASISSLKEQNRTLSDNLSVLCEEKKTCDEELNNSYVKLESALNENDEIKNEIKEKLVIIKRNEAKIIEMENELKNSAMIVEGNKEEIASLNNKIGNLNEAFESLKDENTLLNNNLSSLKTEVNSLKEVHHSMETENNSLKNEIASLNDEVCSLKTDILNEQNENLRFTEKETKMKAEIENYQNTIREKENELITKENEINLKENEIKGREIKSSDIEESINLNEEEIKRIEKENLDLKNEIKKFDQIYNENEILLKENEKLNSDLMELRLSISSLTNNSNGEKQTIETAFSFPTFVTDEIENDNNLSNTDNTQIFDSSKKYNIDDDETPESAVSFPTFSNDENIFSNNSNENIDDAMKISSLKENNDITAEIYAQIKAEFEQEIENLKTEIENKNSLIEESKNQNQIFCTENNKLKKIIENCHLAEKKEKNQNKINDLNQNDKNSEDNDFQKTYLKKILMEFFQQDDIAREAMIPVMLNIVGCDNLQVQIAIQFWKETQKKSLFSFFS